MICPKCGEKYEDDMPKCLWCDAPNPNYGLEPPEEQPQEEQQEGTQKGTLIFWMCALLGEAGIHCFMSGKVLRGIIYALCGGVIIGFWTGFLGPFGIHLPVEFHLVAYLASLPIVVLKCIDIWKIAQGKYSHSKKGFKYRGATWMTVIALLVILFDAGYATVSVIGHAANGFLNLSSYDRSVKAKTLSETEQEHSEVAAAIVEVYMKDQEQFFKNENKLGHFKDIGYSNPQAEHFFMQDIGSGIAVTYKSFMGCTYGSTWYYNASIQDGKIVWYITTPEDGKCKESFPKLYEIVKEPDTAIEEPDTEKTETETEN